MLQSENPGEPSEPMKHWSESGFFWGTAIFIGFCVAILRAVSPELWSSPLLLIQDDARHFVVWLRQMAQPNLFPSDPIAEYFQALTPVVYKMLFLPTKLFEVDVVTWQFLFVAPVACLLLVISAYRLLSLLLHNTTYAGFATLFLCYTLVDVALGLPRSFGYSILFFSLSSFLEDKRWLLIISIFFGVNLYPVAALIACLTMFCFVLLMFVDEHSLSRKKIENVVAAGIAGILGITVFLLGTSGTGPAITLAEARLLPIFGQHGRTSFFSDTLLAQIFGDGRGGILPLTIGGKAIGPFLSLGITITVIVLGLYGYKRISKNGPAQIQKNFPRLIISLVAAGIILFAIAYAVAFKGHLPSKYAKYSIFLVYYFSQIVIVIVFLRKLSGFIPVGIIERLTSLGKIALFVVAWFAFIAHVSDKANIIKDTEPAISSYLRKTPVDAVVAGIAKYINNVPAFTNRSVYVSIELLVPYKRDYYNRMAERIHIIHDLYKSPLGPEFARMVEKTGIDFFIVAHDRLKSERKWINSFPILSDIPERYIFSENRWATETCTIVHGNEHDLINAECMRNLALKTNHLLTLTRPTDPNPLQIK